VFITPGHTASTLSLMFQVKDRGLPHMVAEWGGTSLSATPPARWSMRKSADPHPFVVGPDSVNRWMTVFEECGRKMQAERSA